MTGAGPASPPGGRVTLQAAGGPFGSVSHPLNDPVAAQHFRTGRQPAQAHARSSKDTKISVFENNFKCPGPISLPTVMRMSEQFMDDR